MAQTPRPRAARDGVMRVWTGPPSGPPTTLSCPRATRVPKWNSPSWLRGAVSAGRGHTTGGWCSSGMRCKPSVFGRVLVRPWQAGLQLKRGGGVR